MFQVIYVSFTDALEKIAQQIGKSIPGLTVEDIKNKINGIRSQYVSELNRVLTAESKSEPFEPTLWFFDKISFLKGYTQPKVFNGMKNTTNDPEFTVRQVKSINDIT